MEIVFSQHRPLSHANVSKRAVISLGKVILAQKSGYPVLREHHPRSHSVARACVWSLWEGGGAWRAVAVPAEANPAGSVCSWLQGFTLAFHTCWQYSLLLPRYCPQIISDHPWWSGECHGSDTCYMQSFSRENPRQAEGIFVFCGKIQILFADFHFSHFRGLTTSQGIRAVSKLSPLLGTPVAGTPCHRGNKRSVLGSIFQYQGILKISVSYFLLCLNKTMSGF